MIRTLKYAVRHSPENAQAIGYQATQQNLAYNHAVELLNREPELPKRSSPHCPDALSKRNTKWRQENRSITQAPYHIHQLGAEQAWQANHLLQQSRAELLGRRSPDTQEHDRFRQGHYYQPRPERVGQKGSQPVISRGRVGNDRRPAAAGRR